MNLKRLAAELEGVLADARVGSGVDSISLSTIDHVARTLRGLRDAQPVYLVKCYSRRLNERTTFVLTAPDALQASALAQGQLSDGDWRVTACDFLCSTYDTPFLTEY